jgi:hypothetical protein
MIEIATNEEELTLSNCISRFRLKSRFDVSITSEADFIASHFFEFTVDALRDLKSSELEDIFQNEKLCLESEDTLFDFLVELESDYLNLIGYVRLEFLNPESIDRFFKTISYSDVDERLWTNICRRARHQLVYEANEIPLTRFRSIVRSPDSPFSGLIDYLTSICGGNVHERGAVEITCSSNDYNNCWQVANFDWNNYWHSKNCANSWIQFDFNNRDVSLTHYTLKSDGHASCHLLQWTLAGSRDGTTWELIDVRNTQELNGNYLTKTFSCSVPSDGSRFYRYIRLTQTGKNSSGHDVLMLGNVEFFGTMSVPPVTAVKSTH